MTPTLISVIHSEFQKWGSMGPYFSKNGVHMGLTIFVSHNFLNIRLACNCCIHILPYIPFHPVLRPIFEGFLDFKIPKRKSKHYFWMLFFLIISALLIQSIGGSGGGGATGTRLPPPNRTVFFRFCICFRQ